MDALAVLKADHDKVRNLFIEFRAAQEASDSSKMGATAGKIFEELELHTAIEERVFYPAIKEAGGSSLADLTDESNEEHHVVDLLMAEIKKLDPSDDSYSAKMTVLIENVEHHAGEEEKEMFPQVRNLLSQQALDDLGSQLQQEKHTVTVEKMTLDELRDAASSLEIDGRSDMARNELAAAVLGSMVDQT